MDKQLSHLSPSNQPAMVDVHAKQPTLRTARASGRVLLPPALSALLVDGELPSPKGPVFQTAIIAGTMAAKRTDSLIPFCHSLPLESCKLEIALTENGVVDISAVAVTTAKTGVEMEALMAVSIAALTIYDMCKSGSPGIVIQEIKLMEKTGGKSDYHCEA